MRIHAVLVNNLALLAYTADAYSKKAPSEAIGQRFGEFGLIVLDFLHVHHDDEEQVVFPAYSKRFQVDVDTLIGEHVEMLKIFEEAKTLFSKIKASKAADATPQLFKDTSAKVTELRDFLIPHLEKEDTWFRAEVLNKNFTAKEQEAIEEEIVKLAKSHSGNPGTMFGLIVYSLEDSQRSELLSQLPCIVTKLLIPHVWKKAWEPFCTFFLFPPPQYLSLPDRITLPKEMIVPSDQPQRSGKPVPPSPLPAEATAAAAPAPVVEPAVTHTAAAAAAAPVAVAGPTTTHTDAPAPVAEPVATHTDAPAPVAEPAATEPISAEKTAPVSTEAETGAAAPAAEPTQV